MWLRQVSLSLLHGFVEYLQNAAHPTGWPGCPLALRAGMQNVLPQKPHASALTHVQLPNPSSLPCIPLFLASLYMRIPVVPFVANC
eukprot:1147241-Pelagomonas_calceolata.AAC.3